MKRLVIFAGLLFTSIALLAQNQRIEYDSTLAKSLGADDYGMKSYILVILKTGTNRLEAGHKRDSLFKGHMNNINRLAEDGKMVIAGPFESNEKSYRGIFILNVKTKEEAEELLKSDPTIKEKIFETELYGWYGSAAISEYLNAHKKIEKMGF